MVIEQVPGPVEHILALARQHLGMDLAFLGEFVDEGDEVIRWVSGDRRSVSIHPGMSVHMHEGYCERMVDGRLSCIVRDAKRNERVKDLEVTRTADIGSYIGVPVVLFGGRL
ncbi:hypothetical protein BH20ACT22_BH20ACT22_10220 [soil metagenome]